MYKIIMMIYKGIKQLKEVFNRKINKIKIGMQFLTRTN
jgi:hypothetical protein